MKVSVVEDGKIKQVVHDLKIPKVVQTARACGLGDSLAWLAEFMKGTIPTHGLTQNPIVSKCANFGTVETIGVPPRLHDLPSFAQQKQMQTPCSNSQARSLTLFDKDSNGLTQYSTQTGMQESHSARERESPLQICER